jgi:Notch-like protein
MTTKGKPNVCPFGGADCNDTADAKGPNINPGKTETCLTAYDDNCNDEPNDLDAIACSDFYYDSDKDGWGNSTKPKLCLCAPQGSFSATKVGDCNDNSNAASTYSYEESAKKTIELGGTCGIGQCKGGTVVCAGNSATCSTGGASKTEVCNGIDDDCDGATDADDNSLDLSGETCTGKGICAAATAVKSCAAGKLVCDYTGAADFEATESKCDGKDNDCDGSTDESINFGAFACSKAGVCGTADVTPQCKAGVPTCDYSGVTNHQATEDKCDGKDNDCDGTTDESPNLSSVTCKSKGICDGKTVTKSCSSGAVTCDYSAVAGYEADEESCNLKDDDCDGTTDEVTDVLKSNCKLVGVCNGSNVAGTCTAGTWVCNYTAVTGYEAVEISVADSKDNDCDGQTDEAP